jgi:hypothetical protein
VHAGKKSRYPQHKYDPHIPVVQKEVAYAFYRQFQALAESVELKNMVE